MEPNFGKRATRAFVCSGLSGNLVMRERGWIGHIVRNILVLTFPPLTGVVQGVKIYDTQCQGWLATIDRTSDSPRVDLFKCSLFWQDDSTLLIRWADTTKVHIRVWKRPSAVNPAAIAKIFPYAAEIAPHLKLDATISGLVTALSQTTEMGTPKLKAPLAMLVLQLIQNANPAQRKQRRAAYPAARSRSRTRISRP